MNSIWSSDPKNRRRQFETFAFSCAFYYVMARNDLERSFLRVFGLFARICNDYSRTAGSQLTSIVIEGERGDTELRKASPCAESRWNRDLAVFFVVGVCWSGSFIFTMHMFAYIIQEHIHMCICASI